MIAVPTPDILRRSSRRLDRLNRSVAIVMNALRAGQCLHLEFFQTGPKWRTSNGHYVSSEVAKIIIADKRVIGVGDTLFADGMSQTWRYVEEYSA